VAGGEVVARGLSMPHSPCLHDGRLWLRESGLEFQTAVEEIFDVQLLPGLRFPEVVGFQKETFHHTFIIPSEHKSVGP
jgi:hypothetical protein